MISVLDQGVVTDDILVVESKCNLDFGGSWGHFRGGGWR